MRFLLDMGISPQTGKFLSTQGHDAVHLHDLQLSRADDKTIVELARHHGRIILTHDLDFGNLMSASRERLPSVVIFRLADMKPSNVNKYTQALIVQYADVLLDGAILSVSEHRVRVRRLPVHPDNL